MLNMVLVAVLAITFVLDVILFVRDIRHRRIIANAIPSIERLTTERKVAAQNALAFQLLIAQYQTTMVNVGKQLQDAGIGIQTRDYTIQQLVAALQDIHQIVHQAHDQFVSDEDREILNDAWKHWHQRNINNLSSHPEIVA